MYFSDTLALFMGAFVVWGFLMAMFFNLMLLGFKAKTDLKLVFASAVMFISYFISDHLYELWSGAEVYLNWVVYDIVTLALILPVFFIGKRQTSPGVKYVVIGLCVNTCLHILIHWDLAVLGTDEVWWFWSLYSIGVNLSDLIMIVALIVDRDFLGLVSLGTLVKNKISKVVRRAESESCTAMESQAITIL